MNRNASFLIGATLISVILSGEAVAQGAVQTVALSVINPLSLATGYRTSKVVGSSVVNEANETVGTIDDLIVTPGDKVPYAILSVGGFLGIGTKYVVVSTSSLEVSDKKMLLRGGNKDALKSLPAYVYTK